MPGSGVGLPSSHPRQTGPDTLQGACTPFLPRPQLGAAAGGQRALFVDNGLWRVGEGCCLHATREALIEVGGEENRGLDDMGRVRGGTSLAPCWASEANGGNANGGGQSVEAKLRRA